MRKLDFISRSPQLSIFRESSNKNNLGGVLFLIFIIILILLSIVNISDFVMSERYKFTYTYIKESYDENGISEAKKERYNNLKEDIEFKFDLANGYEKWPLNSNNFRLIFKNESDPIGYQIIEINQTISLNTEGFQLGVIYLCDTTVSQPNCIIRVMTCFIKTLNLLLKNLINLNICQLNF